LDQNKRLGHNGIRTSKFTPASFFPVNLFLQFNKASNIYFLLITVMQMIDLISISGGKPAMAVPLTCVVLVSMVKDAFEDYKRHAADAKENDSCTMVFNAQTKEFESTPWKQIFPGNIVQLKSDEMIPADLLILHTSDEKGTAYVETKNLDGETNLKIKTANKEMQARFGSIKELASVDGEVNCEGPNNAIYNFEGTITIGGPMISLNVDNLLLRGSTIRNTDLIYCQCIY